MMADPRSESMVTNFAAQWLFLRDVEVKEPDLYLFRDFDEGLRKSFERETELFLDSILRENRSVKELLTANYTFLNERLAEHYGMPNIRGSEFRRYTFPQGSPRGGLLGQGSVLTLTSYSTRTSPVLRGKYVLENLLASPPPPPPPNVPSLKTEGNKSRRAVSLREAMVQHRANPACANCHARMDPIGFAMENFDAIGKWRDQDAGKPIDVVSKLTDGTVVDGVEGVKQMILRDPATLCGRGDGETDDVRPRPQCSVFRRAGNSQDRSGCRRKTITNFPIWCWASHRALRSRRANQICRRTALQNSALQTSTQKGQNP